MEENFIEQALKIYKEKQGGPKMREALNSIESVRDFEHDFYKKQVTEALDEIYILYEQNPSIDINPLIELSYEKLGSMESYEVGAFILKQAVKRYDIKIDTDKIREFGHHSVVNSGDKLLRFYENEFGVEFNPEKIAEQAYERVSDTGFAGRALDALEYIAEKGTDIDKKRLDIGALEKVISLEIMQKVRSSEVGIKDAKKHIRFLQLIGIKLVSPEELEGI